MNKENPKIKRIIKLFKNEKCRTIKDIRQALECSDRSAYRLLKKMGYYSSFTHNGKWYSLENIPEFDDNGLWFFKNIGFSKLRGLTATILYLIENSSHGLTARDLSNLLSSSCPPILSKIYKAEKIDRVKSRREFVYISKNSTVNKEQLRNLDQTDILPSLTDADKITILAEFIRFPKRNSMELASHIKKNNGIIFSAETIKNLFVQLGLEKKIVQR